MISLFLVFELYVLVFIIFHHQSEVQYFIDCLGSFLVILNMHFVDFWRFSVFSHNKEINVEPFDVLGVKIFNNSNDVACPDYWVSSSKVDDYFVYHVRRLGEFDFFLEFFRGFLLYNLLGCFCYLYRVRTERNVIFDIFFLYFLQNLFYFDRNRLFFLLMHNFDFIILIFLHNNRYFLLIESGE